MQTRDCGSVRKTSNLGVINSKGEPLVEHNFDYDFRFSTKELLLCRLTICWGYLDINGQILLEPSLPLAWEFEEGFARVINKGTNRFLSTNK